MKPLRIGKRNKPVVLPDLKAYPEGSVIHVMDDGSVIPQISLDGGSFDETVQNMESVEPVILDDPVNHPSHYTDGNIEVSDFIADKNFNFFRGNAIKYISRAGKKDPHKEQEDLEKAIWYLQREIHRMGGYDVRPNPLENVTIMVPHWADQQHFLQQFEDAFFTVWHEGMDAQALADNISKEMKNESLMKREG